MNDGRRVSGRIALRFPLAAFYGRTTVKRRKVPEGQVAIEQAVAHGAKTFNAGHHKACADLYMSTMREMVEYGDQMPEEILTSMKHVLANAERTHSATEQAWTLRHGLDHAYARMSSLQ